MKNHTLLFLFLGTVIRLSAQAPSERLIAYTYDYSAAGAFVPSDSTQFHYPTDSISGGTEQINARTTAHWDTTYYRHYDNGTWHNVNMNTIDPRSTGHSDSFYMKNWNGANYFDHYREQYTYDASYNLINMAVSGYDTVHSVWDTTYIKASTYDASRRILTQWQRYWPYGNSANQYEDTYTYDASGNMLTKTGHYYYNGWIPTWVQTYTYDGNRHALTYTYQSYDTATQVWTYHDGTLHNYDASGRDTLSIDQNWTGSQWQDSRRTTHTYDSHGNTLTGTIQNWITATGSWRNNYTYTRVFDASSNCTSQVTQNWDTLSPHYFNANRHTYTFNTANKLTTDLYELYDTAASTWVNSTKDDKTYTAYNNISQDVYHAWVAGAWTPDRSYGYYWEAFTTPTGIIEQTQASTAVYPNPMNTSATISFAATVNQPATLLIRNMMGQVADTKTINVQNGSNSITYTNAALPAGLYEGEIKMSNGSLTFRLVKD